MKTHSPKEAVFPRNATILIVDDQQVNLDLTSQVFRNRGFRVLTTLRASDVFALVRREHPEIVLLDYLMPDRDGLSVLRELRLHFPETHVIILTGRGSEEIAVTLMKAGAADYILKPFLNRDLVERVEKVLKMRAVEMRNRELVRERDRLLLEVKSCNRNLEARVWEKTEELRNIQAEIVQTEKMATLGYISAGMAHEIRNPLNSIGLYIQLLKEGLDEAERIDFLEKIETEIRRIDDILKKLLDAVNRPRRQPRMISLVETIDSLLDLFQSRMRMHRIKVEREYRVKPSHFFADPTEIEQIFLNLFANSIEEMKEGGVLTITLDQDAETICVHVRDTGKGIPPDDLQRIFDPFYTTKSSGTGLGLAVVLRIIHNYHGKIDVKSKVGKGATFSVYLPLSGLVR